jgi:hypothetical protein
MIRQASLLLCLLVLSRTNATSKLLEEVHVMRSIVRLLTDSTESNECGANECYKCGSVCIETCDYQPAACTKNCVFGCHCADGYVRKSNEPGSPCVKRDECEECDDDDDDDDNNVKQTPECDANEEYNECGSACQATCNIWRYPIRKAQSACTDQCQPGCFCKTGYYRSDDGQCVLPEECCGENELFNKCGSACVETCTSKPRICTKQCVRGCFCRQPNFVRLDNSTNSACVARDECEECS